VAPNPSPKAVGKRLFIPHRLRQLFSSVTAYYQRADASPSHRIGSYLHRIANYISPQEARLTSASQVPLSSTTLPQPEYDFTTACEAWARSFDLNIFNDLLQPFQTHPLIPVHQAQQPVHQAQQPVHQAQEPVHQALLQDLPALEGPQQTLRIEPPVADDLDIVLRDPTPVVEPTRIPLPPSPPSVELALHDCPVEPVSQEIVIPDAAPIHEPREPASSVATESTDILDHTFRGLELDNTMSPGQPQPFGQAPAASQPPEHNTEMASELQLLRTEMENMRLAHESDSSELRRLWDINQSNEQALKRAELAYKEEVHRRQALETEAARASQRKAPAAPLGLASSRHAPPGLGEPGPSNWQGSHRPTGLFPTQMLRPSL
jgi:hypothetical protein